MDVPILHIITCAIIAIIGSSFSAMDREFKAKAFFWHSGMAGFIGAMIPMMQRALCPSYEWYICTMPSFIVGFCVYGIAVALRKTDTSAGGINLTELLKDKLTKKDQKQ